MILTNHYPEEARWLVRLNMPIDHRECSAICKAVESDEFDCWIDHMYSYLAQSAHIKARHLFAGEQVRFWFDDYDLAKKFQTRFNAAFLEPVNR